MQSDLHRNLRKRRFARSSNAATPLQRCPPVLASQRTVWTSGSRRSPRTRPKSKRSGRGHERDFATSGATASYRGGARHLRNGRAVLREGTRVRYRFINDHRHEFRIAVMCWVLEVTRGGFYQWLNKTMSDRAIEDQCLLGLIHDSYVASGGIYGARRVFGDLREAGETCRQHRVERIMQANKIQAVRDYKAPRLSPGALRSSLRTGSIANSPSIAPIERGSPISPTCALGRGGSTWPWSSTCTRAKWWIGR